MIRRSLTPALVLLIMLVAPVSRADSEYWMYVGSYSTHEEAAAARERAGKVLPESFSIDESEVDGAMRYRVVSGPYLTQSMADHMVDEARRQGFDSPEVQARETTLAGSIDEYAGSLLDSEPAPTEDPIDIRNLHLDTADEPSMDIPGFNAPVRVETEKEYKLVREAPAGYRLNSLHRDQ
jgi:hypothetical protein